MENIDRRSFLRNGGALGMGAIVVGSALPSVALADEESAEAEEADSEEGGEGIADPVGSRWMSEAAPRGVLPSHPQMRQTSRTVARSTSWWWAVAKPARGVPAPRP